MYRNFSTKVVENARRAIKTMPLVNLKFSNQLEKSDPALNPVFVIGQLDHLKSLRYALIKAKLEPRVSEDVSRLTVGI